MGNTYVIAVHETEFSSILSGLQKCIKLPFPVPSHLTTADNLHILEKGHEEDKKMDCLVTHIMTVQDIEIASLHGCFLTYKEKKDASSY